MKNRTQIKIRTDDVLRLLATRNMSRSDLARAVGSSRGYMTQIINGDCIPGPDIRSRILEALGCAFEDIFLIGKRTPVQVYGAGGKVQPGPRQAH